MGKRKSYGLLLLLLTALLLQGCESKERTLLLPPTDGMKQEEEKQSTEEGISVKRIYTYTYVSDRLEQSAFLKNCGEHEIRILAETKEEGELFLECRQVDYRYGFYDTLGRLSWMEGDEVAEVQKRYLSWIKPSKDGRQAVIYGGSSHWDTGFVWLYDFERQAIKILYADSGAGSMLGDLWPSFSPNGRWVTFDAKGIRSGLEKTVPLYDCQKEDGWVECEAGSVWHSLEDGEGEVVYPDRTLKAVKSVESELFPVLRAELVDLPDGEAGLLGFMRGAEGQLRAVLEHPGEPDQAPAFLECNLDWGRGSKIPYFWYQMREGGKEISYVSDLTCLKKVYMEELLRHEEWELSAPIPAFWEMDSEDCLILLSPVTKAMVEQNFEWNGVLWSLRSFQNALDVPYLDLYFYEKHGSEGELLYKNIHELITFEYDEDTKRILLEVNGEEEGTRTCIILEL